MTWSERAARALERAAVEVVSDREADPRELADAKRHLMRGEPIGEADFRAMTDLELAILEAAQVVDARARARRSGSPLPELPADFVAELRK